MSKLNNKYWEMRSIQAENRKIKAVRELENDISVLSTRYKKLLNRKMLYWISRFADGKEMSMAEAKKYLTVDDIDDLKADVWEYIQLGEGLGIDNKQWDYMTELSTKYHISRLESLYVHVDSYLSLFLANEVDLMNKTFDRLAKNSYYNVVYDVGMGIGADVNLFVPNPNKLSLILKEPWTKDGIEFSKRIWGEHRNRLSNVIKK